MIDLTVKTLDSQNHAFSLDDDQITVRGFKEHIAESVAVPADSQRLIYCGRVLQDEKKLNDYDVNGKVIHLVQRAPPQPSQSGNDGGQSQGQNNYGPLWQNLQRMHYRLSRAQMHGNAMYLGAMSVPTEIVEGHGLPVPQLSNTLSVSRLVVARRMFDRANELIDRLNDPTCPLNPPSSESHQPPLVQQVQGQELEREPDENNEGRINSAVRVAEAAVAALAAALSASGTNNVTLVRGNGDDGVEARATTETTEETQQDAQQPSEQQGSTSSTDGQSNRRTPPHLPRPPQMAELLERLLTTQNRLRPFIERYHVLMLADPSLPPGAGPEGVEENQRIVDGVSETLHYLSHACHALSDIIVDMGQQPPRNLRCRPIIIQHSAILQPGIPIQVEAHISLHGRNANNNNGNEETSDTASTAVQSETDETTAEATSQQQEPENVSQQQAEQQPQQQEPTQSQFGTVFLPNNLEVLMEVGPESNMEAASGSEQPQTGESNNNNNNAGRISGTNIFPWGSAPPPDFVRNLMQAVAGYVVQGGITTTTITTRNPPLTVGGQQPITTSLDTSNTNAGQSTQARSNVGTHPTTATQTRSTSRPHVFHQQAHPLGGGVSIGLDFDPFLSCNSHHVRRTSNTPTTNPLTATSQGPRTTQTSTSETQTQAQTVTTSATTSNTSSTTTAPPTMSQANAANPLINLLQQTLGSTSAQLQGNININNIYSNIMQTLGSGNIHVGFVGERGGNSSGGGITLADLLVNCGIAMDPFTSTDPGNAENFLANLSVLVAQNMTLEGLLRLRIGHWEPIAQLRRPLREFFQYLFPNTAPETIQEQAAERLLSQLRPHLQALLAEEENGGRGYSRVDICATVESLLRHPIKEILEILFNNDVDDARFGQEILNIVNRVRRQIFAVLLYSVRGGRAGVEALATRFMTDTLEGIHPALREWMLNGFIANFRAYFLHVPRQPDLEILSLLIFKEAPSQAASVPLATAHPPTQGQSEVEPMETEAVEERTSFEASLPNDGDKVPETFPGHEALPSNWVPIIARDGVRQRRQLRMQDMANGGVPALSDAYIGTLPTKRRKLIEQQKPRLLVSPTPNHSAITASMERLVREGVSRAGLREVEGAAVAVAADPDVRRAFGQAIRDCLNPRGSWSPDFPDPARFPNATKYFADQEKPAK